MLGSHYGFNFFFYGHQTDYLKNFPLLVMMILKGKKQAAWGHRVFFEEQAYLMRPHSCHLLSWLDPVSGPCTLLLIYCVALNTPWSIPFNEKERFTLYFIYIWVILFGFCLRICKYPTCAVPWGPEDCIRSPQTGMADACVSCGCGNQTQVLCKSSQCT